MASSNFSDTQSGMLSNVVSRFIVAPTGAGTCPAVPAGAGWSLDNAAVTLTGGNDADTLTTNKCYYWRLVGTNNALLTGTVNTASVLVDTTAPSGGTLQANGSATASFSTSTTVAVASSNFTDAQSGMLSNVVSRFIVNPSGTNTCPAVPGGAGWTVDNAAVTLPGGNDADTLVNGKCYYWRLVGTNNALLTGTVNTASVLVDTTAPTVTGVSATNPSATYGSGTNIDVTVTFSEPVVVVGTPAITLNTTPAHSATYTGGTGTSTITLRYTVLLGDDSARLDYTATTALSAGTSIKDLAGNDATRTLATPGVGNVGSLANAKNIVISAAPSVQSLTTTAAAGTTYSKAGDTVTINLNFDTPVDVVGSPLLTLNTTPSRTATCASGTNLNPVVCTYTVLAGDTASALDWASTSALSAGTSIKDTGGSHSNAILTLPAPSAFTP